MKRVGLEQATLSAAVEEAQDGRIILTRDGKPVALLIGIEGLDEEQLQLGASDKFWSLIAGRRTQKGLNRAELAKKLRNPN